MTLHPLDSLFSAERPPAPHQAAEPSPARVPRQRQATLDLAALRAQLGGGLPGPQVRLPLFHDTDYVFQTQYTERHADDGLIWEGTLTGLPETYACLAVTGLSGSHGGPVGLSGTVHVGQLSYTLSSTPEGHVVIREYPANAPVSPEQWCGTPHPDTPSHATHAFATGLPPEYQDLPDPVTPVTIRLLVLYPAKTREAAGGEAALQAKLLVAQQLMNNAFVESGIKARGELVWHEEPLLSAAGGSDDAATYLQRALGLGKEPDEALTDRIRLLLKRHQADVAVLLAPAPAGTFLFGAAGHRPTPPSANDVPLKNRVLAMNMSVGGTEALLRGTLTHELGHLLGAAHDRFTYPTHQDDDAVEYDAVRGYTPDDRAFTTLMGYPSRVFRTHRVNVFSSPDLKFRGTIPMGIAAGQPNAADAVSFLKLSTQVVAQYKGAIHDPHLMPLTLSVQPALGGSIVLDTPPGPYPPQTMVVAKAIPRAGGYVFSHWLLDGQPRHEHPLPVRMDRPHFLEARFEASQASCRIEVNDARLTLTPPGGIYPAGTDIHLVPHLDDTTELLSLTIDGHPVVSSGSAIYLRVAGHHKIVGTFGKRVHQFVQRAVPLTDNDLIEVGGLDGKWERLGAADRSAVHVAYNGATFDHWRVNGKPVSGDDPVLDLEVTADTLVEACSKGWEHTHRVRLTSNVDVSGTLGYVEDIYTFLLDRIRMQQHAVDYYFSPGTKIYLIPEPVDTHYKLSRWTLNGKAMPLIAFSKATHIVIDGLTEIHLEYHV